MPKMTAKPSWLKVRAPQGKAFLATQDLMRLYKLNTVCEEAACPNIGECWSKKHATVMILGSICTRACRFCNVTSGKPDKLDPHEPDNVATSVGKLGLKHVVITSVDRDDLEDGGADHFAQCITKIREANGDTTIEVLTPDFLNKPGCAEIVADARPDVFNHNIETVPRLYATIRPKARYFHSLHILKLVKQRFPHMFTKSGIMVGLGEMKEEVLQVMDDMRAAEVDFITIGQYLQPTKKHAPVMEYITPQDFDSYSRAARSKGFLMVSATPLTRSSYHAGKDFLLLQSERAKRLAS